MGEARGKKYRAALAGNKVVPMQGARARRRAAAVSMAAQQIEGRMKRPPSAGVVEQIPIAVKPDPGLKVGTLIMYHGKIQKVTKITNETITWRPLRWYERAIRWCVLHWRVAATHLRTYAPKHKRTD